MPSSPVERRWKIIGTKGNRPNVVRGPQLAWAEGEVEVVDAALLQKEKDEREKVETDSALAILTTRERLNEAERRAEAAEKKLLTAIAEFEQNAENHVHRRDRIAAGSKCGIADRARADGNAYAFRAAAAFLRTLAEPTEKEQ